MRESLATKLFPHLRLVGRVVDPKKSEEEVKEPMELEKGDLKAMIIAGFLVFGIPVAILAAIMLLAMFLLS